MVDPQPPSKPLISVRGINDPPDDEVFALPSNTITPVNDSIFSSAFHTFQHAYGYLSKKFSHSHTNWFGVPRTVQTPTQQKAKRKKRKQQRKARKINRK